MAHHNANQRSNVSAPNPTTTPAQIDPPATMAAAAPDPAPITITASIARPSSQAAKPGRKAGTSYIMLAQATVTLGELTISIPVWMSASPTSDGSEMEITPSVGSLPRGLTVPDDLRSRIDQTIEQTIADWSDWDAACQRAETLLMRKPAPAGAAGKPAADRLAPRLVRPAKPSSPASAPAQNPR